MKKMLMMTSKLFLSGAIILGLGSQIISTVQASSEENEIILDNTNSQSNETHTNDSIDNQNLTDTNEGSDGLVKIKPYALGFATFDGIDLTGVNSKTYDIANFTVNARTLSVNEKFSGAGDVSNRKITIKLEPGLALATAPGFTNNKGVWTFDTAKLPAEKQGIISGGTFTPSSGIYGYQPKSGTIEYTLSPGATAIGIDITTTLEANFAANVTSRDLSNLLSVKSSADISGVPTTISEESFETITVSPTFNIQPVGRETFYTQAGSNISVRNSLFTHIGGSIPGGVLASYPLIFDSLVLTYKIPKVLTVNNVSTTDNKGTPTFTADSTSDPSYTIVVVTMKNIATSGVYLIFDLTIPSNATDGTKYEIGTGKGSYNAIPYGSTNEIGGALLSDPSYIIVSRQYDNMFSLNDTTNKVYYNSTDVSNTDGINLGYFSIKNDLSDALTNQTIKTTFDDTVIQVKAVKLQTGSKTEIASNIVVKTNNRTITIPTKSNTSGSGITFWTNIDMKTLGYPDEYIKEVTYELATVDTGIGSQAFNSIVYPSSVSMAYYGSIIAPEKGSYISTIETTNDGNFSGPNVESAKNTVSIISDNNYSPAVSSDLSGKTVLAGDLVDVIDYISTTHNTFNYTVNTKIGFDIYLREDEYFTINPDTIKIKDPDTGTIYSATNGDFIPTIIIDNTGNRVFKIVVPYIKVGGFLPDGSARPAATLTYSMSVKKSAPTVSVNLSSLLQIIPHTGNVSYNSGTVNTTVNNIFDIDGSSDLNKLIASAPSNQTVNVQAQKDFTVTSAANLNNGPWVSYDYKTNQSIINLNPEGKAKYQLTVANNSGNIIEGYTALIPIPKFGEKTDLTPTNPAAFDPSIHLQEEAFSWTASIDQPVIPTGTLGYTVLYATTYETDKDSPLFLPWSAIVNKDDIRMVKVTTITPIPDGFNESFDFPLVLSDSDADAHAGNINIYSARIHRVIADAEGYKPSEPIAIRLKTGVVKGQIFNDLNRDGLLTIGEIGRAGVSVVAYETGTSTIIETVTTNTNGEFSFLGLDKSQNVDIVFINPSTTDALRFSNQTTNGSQGVVAVDKLTAKISNVIPSGTNSDNLLEGIITALKISYNTNGGAAVLDDTKYPGEAITTAPVTSKEGYTFTGWFTAATGGSKVVFPYTVGTTDVTLYAQYTANKYVLSYDIATNGGEGTKPADESVTFDTLATQPADALKTGYNFAGWFTAATGGTKWDFTTSKMPASAVKLYAQFTVGSYTMTFDNEGVTTTQSVVFDTLVTEPTAPTKTGYTFNGWFSAATGGTKWNFSTVKMPASNITLYAQYTVNKYVLSYDIATNGGEGTKPADESVTFDTLATQPADALKTGATFTGWFTAATGGTKWNFTTSKMPASAVKLYAQFVTNTYKADIQANDFTLMLSNAGSTLGKDGLISATENEYNNVNTLISSIDEMSKVTVNATELATIKAATTGGVHPLTYTVTTTHGITTSKTVLVTLTKDGTTPIVVGNVQLAASDFSAKLSDVATMDVYSLSGAFANEVIDNGDGTFTINPLTVTADATELAAIQGATTVGVYPLTFSATDGTDTATKTVLVTLTKDGTTPIVVGNVQLAASDFSAKLSDVATMDVYGLSGAFANEVIDNGDGTFTINPLTVTADTTELAAIQGATTVGVYPLTFSATDGTDTATKTILVTLTKDGTTPIVVGNVQLAASDFSAKLSDVATMDVYSLSGAFANEVIDNGDGTFTINPLTVTADTTELAAIQGATTVGVYPLTFSATDGTDTATKTILVTLTKDGTPPVIVGNVYLLAHDFTINIKAVPNFDAKQLAEAKAYEIIKNTDGTVTITDLSVDVDATQLATIQSTKVVGTYPLTLSATGSGFRRAFFASIASKTINVTVTAEPIGELPSTGEPEKMIPVLSGVSLIGLALIVLIRKKSK